MQKKIEFVRLRSLKEVKDKTDQWIAKTQDECLFCAEPLLRRNFKYSVKDHCHITGKYRGAAHNACNLKLRIKPKTNPIPVVFHNLRGHDAHHLMQAMSRLDREVRCVANNMEKYITFSVGGLSFIDSLNFLRGNLDYLVKATPQENLTNTPKIAKGRELLFNKGIYSCEYMDSCFV